MQDLSFNLLPFALCRNAIEGRSPLNTQGYDVVQVSDVNPRMIDQKILSWANREKRIIITTDNDFEQMIWLQKKPHCGVLRLQNIPRIPRQILLEKVLANYSLNLINGAIIIATQQKIRIRNNL